MEIIPYDKSFLLKSSLLSYARVYSDFKLNKNIFYVIHKDRKEECKLFPKMVYPPLEPLNLLKLTYFENINILCITYEAEDKGLYLPVGFHRPIVSFFTSLICLIVVMIF